MNSMKKMDIIPVYKNKLMQNEDSMIKLADFLEIKACYNE